MRRLSLVPFLLVALPVAASAQSFSDDFDADHTSAWKFNSSIAGDAALDGNGNEANFFFDYSTVGIASAPHSVGGTTRGLKLESDVFGTVSPNTLEGVSVSPIGKSFTGDYVLRFDAWLNFQGPLPGGGNGTTQAMIGGIGGSKESFQYVGGTINGAGFAATGDGGSSSDYRAYTAGGAIVGEGTGAYASGTTVGGANGATNSSNAYYSRFKGAVPTAQTTYAQGLGFNGQTGSTGVGALGLAWHSWEIARSGTKVTWTVDGLRIATVDKPTFTGDNIFLGYFDTNGNPSTDAISRQLLFGLVDNVTVSPVPEPASMLALGLGAVAMLRRRKKA